MTSDQRMQIYIFVYQKKINLSKRQREEALIKALKEGKTPEEAETVRKVCNWCVLIPQRSNGTTLILQGRENTADTHYAAEKALLTAIQHADREKFLMIRTDNPFRLRAYNTREFKQKNFEPKKKHRMQRKIKALLVEKNCEHTIKPLIAAEDDNLTVYAKLRARSYNPHTLHKRKATVFTKAEQLEDKTWVYSGMAEFEKQTREYYGRSSKCNIPALAELEAINALLEYANIGDEVVLMPTHQETQQILGGRKKITDQQITHALQNLADLQNRKQLRLIQNREGPPKGYIQIRLGEMLARKKQHIARNEERLRENPERTRVRAGGTGTRQ